MGVQASGGLSNYHDFVLVATKRVDIILDPAQGQDLVLNTIISHEAGRLCDKKSQCA